MTEEFITSREPLAHTVNQTKHFVFHLPDHFLKQHEKTFYDNKLKGKPLKDKKVDQVSASAFFKYRDLAAPFFKMDHIMNSLLRCV